MCFLATYGDRGSGVSYYNVAPLLQGTWRQYEDAVNPGVTLRSEPGSGNIQILSDASSPDYGQIYSETVQFGTLGVALCDEDGLPHWTVVLGRDYDAENGPDPDGSPDPLPGVHGSHRGGDAALLQRGGPGAGPVGKLWACPAPRRRPPNRTQQQALAETPPRLLGREGLHGAHRRRLFHLGRSAPPSARRWKAARRCAPPTTSGPAS